ncbi:MAG: (2Fe-2S)-binding protein [Candidatus Bathyarchaeia archaeon]|jgi:carbon-monoxide dehydrogenase small subunit
MKTEASVEIRCTVNSTVVHRKIAPNQTLCDFLHDEMGLTGVKKGCDTGECGACTVLMDGKPITSCLVLAPQIDGHNITTIEGLGSEKSLHPVQEAFLELDAAQCGYCIPGMIMTASALVKEKPNLTETELKRHLSGNLCRCTGYQQQVQAVMRACKKIGTFDDK